MDKKFVDFIMKYYEMGKTELPDPTGLVTKDSIITFVRGAVQWEATRTDDPTPVILWMEKLEISFAMLIAMTEKLAYGVIDAMKYQLSMAGLVKNLLKWIKFVLDKQRILWYNTDVVERLGNLFIVNLLEYSPEHDDKRLNMGR